jgi:hypothetical protein
MPSAWAIEPSPLISGASWYDVAIASAYGVRLALPLDVGAGDGGAPLGLLGLAARELELVAGAVPGLGRLGGAHRGLLEPLVGQHEVGLDGGDVALGVPRGVPGLPDLLARRRRLVGRGTAGDQRDCYGGGYPHGSSHGKRLLVMSGDASSDFPIARGTRSTLMRSRHNRNSFHNFFFCHRRVGLRTTAM